MNPAYQKLLEKLPKTDVMEPSEEQCNQQFPEELGYIYLLENLEEIAPDGRPMRNVGQCVDYKDRMARYAKPSACKSMPRMKAALGRVPFSKWRKRVIWRPRMSEMNDYEVMLIAQYKATDPAYGFNMNLGGNLSRLGRPHTKESKELCRKNHKGTREFKKGHIPSEKTRTLWSKQRRGVKRGRYKTRGRVFQVPSGKWQAWKSRTYCGTHDTMEAAYSHLETLYRELNPDKPTKDS